MLQSLNTKATGYIGIVMFIVELLNQTAFQGALTKALPASSANYLNLAWTIVAFAAAYYGMPHTVPTKTGA